MSNTIFGGIEGGGTHFNCIIAKDPKNILYENSFPTSSPSETVGKAIHFFTEHIKRGVDISSVGIGSFGPWILILLRQLLAQSPTLPNRDGPIHLY